MSKGLKKWFNEKWVDISAKKPGGGYKECGRKSASGSSRGYPKCVPAAKAAKMSEGERRSAVARKRSAPNTGPKPDMIKTKIKKMQSGALTVTPQVKKGGLNKYSTINQDETVIGTGGFADSNYQQQVKKLIED